MSDQFGFPAKWQLARHWTLEDPALTRSALRVLMILLEHCNPRHLRCDPSIDRLAQALNLSRKSITSAINELRERGAIKTRKSEFTRNNQYDFLWPSRVNRLGRSKVKSASLTREASFRLNMKPASPKKEKEKKKKRGPRHPGSLPVGQVDPCGDTAHGPGTAKHQKHFLDEITKKLREHRLPEELLVEIDSKVPDEEYRAFCDGTKTREASIEAIFEACLEIAGYST